MKNSRCRWLALSSCAVLCALVQSAGARDLTDATLEDLMNMQVTSVSKREQKVSHAGAAIFVITQEDIRRSGVTNIPDLLRMAPGVDVARIDSNKWAISIRGFNDQHADKVLVLIDGRSVYSPSFSGVFWDSQDVPLEDIDRIEVIRGPGGTVWGANAMNGVINIITKNSADTQGGLVTAGTGSERTADGLVQYGGKIGTAGSYRVFGKYFNIDNSVFPGGNEAADGWHSSHVGFRSDWNLSPRDNLTVQGDALETAEGETITVPLMNALPQKGTFGDPIRATNGNLLARWDHVLANGSDMTLQLYDDYSHHIELGFTNVENTVDLDFQHHLSVGSRNDVVWGFGARAINSNYGVSDTLTLLPQHRFDRLYSAFVQDEVKLTGSLALTIGSKFEHNDFTGFEYEPSAQLVWTPANNQTVWLSAARAIRQPSAVDVGLQDDLAVLPAGGTFAVVRAMGNPQVSAERVNDYEAGYRTQLNSRLSLDVAGFASFFQGVIGIESLPAYFTTDPTPPHLVFPVLLVNGTPMHTHGVEFSATWKATPRWRIAPSSSWFHMTAGSAESQTGGPGYNPAHQFQVRSLLDLAHNVEWDTSVGYVSNLPGPNVPAYARVDSRVSWRAGERMELSIVGQNLLSPRHQEFSAGVYPASFTLVERSVFAKVTWRF
ncbi:MAG TPA: TonB-dependent receptor [Bryobacteraceae bacterium]|nr:TonB-dependent receptor [Bryobacteraceae bacterium]